MAPPKANDRTVQYRRTHNLLLGTKLLSQRGPSSSSPFTLILGSLSQSSTPLVEEYISRAKVARINVIFISFVTAKPPTGVSKVVRARGKAVDVLQKEVLAATTQPPPQAQANIKQGPLDLMIFDSMNHLASICSDISAKATMGLSFFLSSLLTPTITMIATYQNDIPQIQSSSTNTYAPEPFELLKYLCTTLITVYAPNHIFAQKRAMDRSLPLPAFGLEEGIEGSFTSLGTNTGWCDTCTTRDGSRALVYELEHRRQSGRPMTEWFFLSCHPSKKTKERLMLLEDHPAYNPTIQEPTGINRDIDGPEDEDLTFSLGLTAKQKTDRDGVVLPYFDAQTEEGGTGGRILYVPGREDDWDEEEDEI